MVSCLTQLQGHSDGRLKPTRMKLKMASLSRAGDLKGRGEQMPQTGGSQTSMHRHHLEGAWKPPPQRERKSAELGRGRERALLLLIRAPCFENRCLRKSITGTSPHGSVAKTLHSRCRGPRFRPWSGSWIPCAATKSLHTAAEAA